MDFNFREFGDLKFNIFRFLEVLGFWISEFLGIFDFGWYIFRNFEFWMQDFQKFSICEFKTDIFRNLEFAIWIVDLLNSGSCVILNLNLGHK